MPGSSPRPQWRACLRGWTGTIGLAGTALLGRKAFGPGALPARLTGRSSAAGAAAIWMGGILTPPPITASASPGTAPTTVGGVQIGGANTDPGTGEGAVATGGVGRGGGVSTGGGGEGGG